MGRLQCGNYARLFLHMLKSVVAMATNRLTIKQIDKSKSNLTIFYETCNIER
jgi:hypothetical protein